jgi:signal transduction histidine kinase
MTERLRAAQEELLRHEKLVLVGRLAAGVAHEIGNPLAAILGYVEVLLASPPGDPRAFTPEEMRDTLERMRRETLRIHRIIQDLNAFARPQEELLGPVDLAEAVAEAVELSARRAQPGALTIDRAGLAELPRARSSALRVTQIVTNLLTNAIDAMGGQGRIEIAGRVDGERVILSVRDHGPGLPAGQEARIFDAFYTTKDPGAGMGLGLTLSLAIARGLGGDLRAANAEGGGACFSLTLPLETASSSAPPVEGPARAAG